MLAAWLLGLGHLLARWLGPGRVLTPDGFTPIGWGVVAAYLVVFLSRGRGDSDLDSAILRRILVVGPLYFVLSIGAPLINGLRFLLRRARAERLGLPIPAAPQGWPGPPLPFHVRRTLALPFEIFGEGVFRSWIASELRLWTGWTAEMGIAPLFERPFFLLLALVLVAAGYLVLVIGPRIVAGATLEWRPWLLRFALYLGAALAGRLEPWGP